MPIQSSEIVIRRSALISDTTEAQNGGRMAAIAPTGVKNNLFPDVTNAQRLDGIDHWRKVFIHLNSTADVPLNAVKIFVDAPTPGGSSVVFYPGLPVDHSRVMSTLDHLWAGISANEIREYGIATAPYQNGATSLTVTFDVSDNTDGDRIGDTTWSGDPPIQPGDTIRIASASGAAATPEGGVEEFRVVTGQVTQTGPNIATFPISQPLAAQYTGTVTVSSVWGIDGAVGEGVIHSSLADFDYTSTGDFILGNNIDGDPVDAGRPTYGSNLVIHNKGGIEQIWAITFTSATAFSCSGDTVGVAGTGTTSADFAPINPDTGTPWFTLNATGWTGTWASGNTLRFTSKPAAVPVWIYRYIPEGVAGFANDRFAIAVQGESE